MFFFYPEFRIILFLVPRFLWDKSLQEKQEKRAAGGVSWGYSRVNIQRKWSKKWSLGLLHIYVNVYPRINQNISSFFCVMAATGNSTAIFNLYVFVDCYLCQPCTHACVEAGKSWSFLSSGISKALDFIQNPDKLIIFKWPRTRSQASRRAAAERCGTVHGLTWPQLARSSQWKFTSCFFTMEIYG